MCAFEINLLLKYIIRVELFICTLKIFNSKMRVYLIRERKKDIFTRWKTSVARLELNTNVSFMHRDKSDRGRIEKCVYVPMYG